MTLCVLNASESRPERLPAEPESRGQILLDMLHLDGVSAIEAYLTAMRERLGRVRSFHVVAVEPARGNHAARSVRFRWDGQRLSRDDHDGPHLYVSSSLDQTGAEQARFVSWQRLLETGGRPDARGLREWLASHDPERGPLSVCMHRPEARTVSRTLVTVEPPRIEMAYLDGPPCAPESDELILRL